MKYDNLIERLQTRAHIRRTIVSRRSVQEGQPDRISDLLDEAAEALKYCSRYISMTDEEYLADKGA